METKMQAGLLESRLSVEDYETLQSLFLGDGEEALSLSRTEFIEQAWSAVGRGSREEYGLLFDSVQGERKVDWEGVTSFLLLELSEKEENERVVYLWFFKVVYLRDSGRYLSVSKGGTLAAWAEEELALLQIHRLRNDSVRPKDLWVTAVVVLHDVHKVAVSYTSKEVCFYDLLSKQPFNCQYKLQGLKCTPLCLDYWSHPTDPSQAVLAIGDTGGKVSAICFRSPQISLFERLSQVVETESADIVKWRELVQGRHSCCYTLTHHAHGPVWVRRVRFLGSLDAFVSCSTSPQSSMVIGWREREGVDMRVLRLWDVASQLCIQRIAGVFPKTQEECHTVLFLHEEHSRLFFSFNSLLFVLEVKKEEGRRVTSHENPVTCVLYNSLFRQVVSSDTGSSVICWLVDTGQKVKHFHRCHGDSEISTMALDGTQTRLFTAGTDGVVKIWDFNGHCHHRLNAGRDQAVAISQVLVLKRTVLVMGWERMLTVFRLHSFSQFFVQPSEWKGGVHHHDDILCAAFLPPQTLVTGSYDGELTVWNNATENALRKLHPDPERERRKAQTGENPTYSLSNGSGEEPESTEAITRLFFLPGRMGAATAGGADLVSCGISGLVRFWNTIRSSLVAEFTAHKDSGSIVMTVSACGQFLVTADMQGRLKTWNIQEFCLQPNNQVTNDAPDLLGSLHPHLDCVTHLELCLHGDRLLLLSSSSDCSVALSYMPGVTVGVFGQVCVFIDPNEIA
uniref:WD repeat domain 49 n=1 Tax=Esox lucius TaxID=8010 RepID=A0A3P8XUC8_ESOLU